MNSQVFNSNKLAFWFSEFRIKFFSFKYPLEKEGSPFEEEEKKKGIMIKKSSDRNDLLTLIIIWSYQKYFLSSLYCRHTCNEVVIFNSILYRSSRYGLFNQFKRYGHFNQVKRYGLFNQVKRYGLFNQVKSINMFDISIP